MTLGHGSTASARLIREKSNISTQKRGLLKRGTEERGKGKFEREVSRGRWLKEGD